MSHSGRLLKLILLVVAAAFLSLFTVQNLGRTAELSLDLGLVAYRLSHPQPIPYMLLASFGTGLLLAGFLGIFQRMGMAKRIRQLEREAATAGLKAADDDWT